MDDDLDDFGYDDDSEDELDSFGLEDDEDELEDDIEDEDEDEYEDELEDDIEDEDEDEYEDEGDEEDVDDDEEDDDSIFKLDNGKNSNPSSLERASVKSESDKSSFKTDDNSHKEGRRILSFGSKSYHYHCRHCDYKWYSERYAEPWCPDCKSPDIEKI